ncbi:VanZ family protein [Pseudohongiella sp.]|uniref:VanZ-like domain-containing protein n=1 Tax=marine sediment metagenome TaxID=412755 RepID=A0A0F9WDU5_9ZZZZ|nr:VanZ family protein [Pseudohongiella sp.]
MQSQHIEHGTVRFKHAAWLALLLTAIVLLTPGAVLDAVQVFIEPTLNALRHWKNSWWPWPVPDATGGGLAVDKIIHALLFAVCGVLAARSWRNTLSLASIALLLVLFGALTEIAQTAIPGRGMSLGDLVADMVGVLAGIGIWQWIGPTRQRTGRGIS